MSQDFFAGCGPHGVLPALPFYSNLFLGRLRCSPPETLPEGTTGKLNFPLIFPRPLQTGPWDVTAERESRPGY